jgi:hypothetical protein
MSTRNPQEKAPVTAPLQGTSSLQRRLRRVAVPTRREAGAVVVPDPPPPKPPTKKPPGTNGAALVLLGASGDRSR